MCMPIVVQEQLLFLPEPMKRMGGSVKHVGVTLLFIFLSLSLSLCLSRSLFLSLFSCSFCFSSCSCVDRF